MTPNCKIGPINVIESSTPDLIPAPLVDELFQPQRGNSVITLYFGRKVRVVSETKVFSDIVEVFALLNQSSCENRTILTKEVFRFHSNHPVKRDLEITDFHPQTLGHTIHHKPLIMSNRKDIPAIPVDDVIPSSVKLAIGKCFAYHTYLV